MNSYDIDKKLEPVLREIEKNGVRIDVDLLKKLEVRANDKIAGLKKDIFELANGEFNINSPRQLSEVLFDKMKISALGVKRKKMHLSTSAQDLDKIKDKHAIVDKILQYREVEKLRNTYIVPLINCADENFRVHTSYAVDTSTGRLSSKNPNLQNIPIRTEIGKSVRKAFIASEGKVLLKADYSQIELRIIAALSNDEKMLEVFRTGGDIHKATAEELKCDRRTAKIVNFGIIYGISAYGLSQTLRVPEKEAQEFIDRYFGTYKGVKNYCDQIVQKAVEEGKVETYYGRVRLMPELKSKIKQVYNFGRRAAMNTPVQGTAADLIKLAMIGAEDKNLVNTDDIKLILQVHDELVFEVKENLAKKYLKIIKDLMENISDLNVPLIVEIESGKNWNDTERMKI